MNMTLTLLASSALGVMMVAIPAISAIRMPDTESSRAAISTPTGGAAANMFVLVSGDDEGSDDDRGGDICGGEGGGDHEGGDHEGGEHEGGDQSALCDTGTAPAPAGTVAPPANGLFAPGAAPSVQVN